MLVEDEDGFQIPVRVNDVVVVENDDYHVILLRQNLRVMKKRIMPRPADL